MATTTHARGTLRVTAPNDWTVTSARPAATQTRRPATRGRRADQASPPALQDALLGALADQDFTHVETLNVRVAPPRPAPRARGRIRGGAPDRSASLELEVEGHEDAVILLEQDGFYSWVFPEKPRAAPRIRGRPRRSPDGPTRTLVFQLNVQPESGRPARRTRSFIGNLLFGKAKAFVFKFAARVGLKKAIKFLERKVKVGLVRFGSSDPAQWLATTWQNLNLPTDRPARILLFVHGTFSSTVGGYHGLGATPWGRTFIDAAIASYDAVIGFDHQTLSVTPLDNATALLHELESNSWVGAPHIDVIAHSRGGLVIRSLVEELLPASGTPVHFNRIIFVAATNAGTALAEPDNWNRLIDLATNLAAVGFTTIGMIPHAAPVTFAVNEAIQGLGALVKYMATEAIDDQLVPGLAAMEPDGTFVTAINKVQAGQPTPATSYYCVMSSDFSVKLDGATPKELPKRFLSWCKDHLADAMMREPNDLIVNIKSMGAIDEGSGPFVKDRLDFGPNDVVHHSNYFLQPQAIDAFTRWLLVAPGGTRTTRSRTRAASVPAAATLDILRISTSTIVKDAIKQVMSVSPSYVVMNRLYQDDILHYAYPTEVFYKRLGIDLKAPTLRSLGGGAAGGMNLEAAFNLHETDRSPTRILGDPDLSLDLLKRGSQPIVIVRNDDAVGVLPPPRETAAAAEVPAARGPLSIDEIVQRAGAVQTPAPTLPARVARRPRGRTRRGALAARSVPPRKVLAARPMSAPIVRRRAMPSFDMPAAAAPEMAMANGGGAGGPMAMANGGPPPRRSKVRRAPPSAPLITCYFSAQMDEQVLHRAIAEIEVAVSREALEIAVVAVARRGKAKVNPKENIVVQVQPRKNFVIAGHGDDPGRIEVPPPAPGKPKELAFSVKATDLGVGEIIVTFYQHQTALIRLVLRPKIVAKRKVRVARLSENGSSLPAEPLKDDLDMLFITERISGSKTYYDFRWWVPRLGLNRYCQSDVARGNKRKYVSSIFKKIEQKYLANEGNDENFLAALQAIGVDLLKQLVPPEIQKDLWQNRDKLKNIWVLSTEPFIPWELVHLIDEKGRVPKQSQFLGQMGVLRWLDNVSTRPTKIKIRPKRAYSVIPKYSGNDELPDAAEEIAFLKKNFGAKQLPASEGAVRDLLRRGNFDLLHFACHGAAPMASVFDATLNLVTEDLDSGQVDAFANLGGHDNQPMIVLSACQSGRSGWRLTGMGGFASAFITKEAGAFVGTLWSVGDDSARVFTETLYKRLRKRDTLSQATIAARAAARRDGDPTWLAYTIYGHPQMRITTK